MPGHRLSPLQLEVLRLLADFEPRWTLTGGGALAAIHTRHRGTRDLDLFWPEREELGQMAKLIEARLRTAGLAVTPLQTAPAFARLQVSRAPETVVLDLVADPGAPVERPRAVDIEGASILVDTAHEILVNKLCALLGRSEIRDLEDVRALLATGGSLERALRDAPRKDLGFSPLTLAWVLREMPLARLAGAGGSGAEETARLDAFREELITALTDLAVPDEAS